MIMLYGKEKETEIRFIGLRAGEKLYEELLIDDSEQKTKYESIYIAKPTFYDYEKLKKDIDYLLKCKDKKEGLKKIVKEFNPKG
jgi:UDP-N-acetyl-D-glucosamine 4,6-dehydratase